MSMLFITHDLGIVRKIADRVCVMTNGKIVEQGPTERIFSDPQHAYTRHLLAAEPKGSPPSSDPAAPVVMQGRRRAASGSRSRRASSAARSTT